MRTESVSLRWESRARKRSQLGEASGQKGQDTPDILKEIVAVKRKEVERLKREASLPDLEARIAERSTTLSLTAALGAPDVSVIAEVKKASPVKGRLREDFDPVRLASAYVDGGAAAVSVLTNFDHFQGTIDDLQAVQRVCRPHGLPVLRKEFIFDPYQVHEARAHGADAILLIVAMLDASRLHELLGLAAELEMESLVEVHDETELAAAVDAGAQIVGINNRDLRTFRTDLETTERLAPQVPDGRTVVSESGIGAREDMARVAAAGAHAVLVGESLVTAGDPAAKLRELL